MLNYIEFALYNEIMMRYFLPSALALLGFFSTCTYNVPRENLEIIIIRHGQADHNVESTRNANPQHPHYKISHLTEQGKQEALAAARQLQEENLERSSFVAVYVSPLPRTQETAQILMEELGIPEEKKHIDSRITERQVGDFEGKPFAPLLDYDIIPESGIETQAEVKARIASFYDCVRRAHREGKIIVVTHGSPAEMLGELISLKRTKIHTGQALTFYPHSYQKEQDLYNEQHEPLSCQNVPILT
jgi:broad specificity phosphatase PhoE